MGPRLRFTPVGAIHARRPAALFGPYRGEGAAWVRGCPLAVNRDYDFATALMLPEVGAAVAAQRRQTDNAALAAELSRAPRCDVTRHFLAALAPRPADALRRSRTTLTIYALLFGGEAARLQTFVIAEAPNRPVSRTIHVSGERPVAGPGSWSADHGAALWRALRAGVSHLARSLDFHGRAPKARSTRGQPHVD